METEEEVDILMSSDIYSATLSTKSITFSRAQTGWLFREDKTVSPVSLSHPRIPSEIIGPFIAPIVNSLGVPKPAIQSWIDSGLHVNVLAVTLLVVSMCLSWT